MNYSRALARIAQQSRKLTTTSSCRASRQARIKELQKKFQVDDGQLVHVKGGTFDRLMYHGTLGLCVFALCSCIYTIVDLSFPPKQQ
ncbi:cytochrome c oxidase subunit 7A2, mitochondrial-like isoform X1 [Tachypleus tridentatus]|uniref:cytochrome c oxidase subunit 7A2, mitochondrial-like isoform X1 n=1 Tax=Tachypleus tridentatus TaxID=6853 RepID=UPI003FD02520